MDIYKLRYDYDFSEVEGDYIATPKNGESTTKALVINETTYRIMMLLQNGISISEVVKKLSEIYTVPNTVLFNDVEVVIEELGKAGLIERNEK